MDLGTRFFVKTAHCSALHGRHFGAGSGAPIVLLHASPMSSKALVPLAQALIDADANLSVIAFDTPGFGHSSALSGLSAAPSLADFADTILDALTQLGIEITAIYGTATGAQIGIEIATRAPERISVLIADGACHFEPQQLENILANYFPSLQPVASGAHLTQAAEMARKLFEFFPWFETAEAYRLAGPVPEPLVLHKLARAYLSASPSYDIAYLLAFENERAEQMAKLRVNTWITRWPNSILLRYTDALLAHTLPSNIQTLNLRAGSARYAEIAAHCAKQLAGANAFQFKTPRVGELCILQLAQGSAVMSTQIRGANALALGELFLHLPGLGLGELYGDAAFGLTEWKLDNEALITNCLDDDSFGNLTARLGKLTQLHQALDGEAALAVLPGNIELLQTWQALTHNNLNGSDSPADLQVKLNGLLDLTHLKARLMGQII